jgi:hypothetical protein
VIDSAGIEIVTNLPGSIEQAETWSLAPEPVVEIGGGIDPEVPLFRVTAVAPLPGRRVAVGMDRPSRVLIFEPDGTLGATLGRQGEGPGEFSGVSSVVALAADSVVVWDPDRRRLSLFTTDGQFVRQVDLDDVAPLSARAAGSPSTSTGFIHLLPSTVGSLLLFAEGLTQPDPDPGSIRPMMESVRVSLEGKELARFGPFPGMATYVGSPAGPLPLPFGVRAYATTLRGSPVFGTAEATEVRIYAPSGEPIRIVRWPDRDRGVGGPFLARWTNLLEARPELRGLVEATPRPESFPAYEGLVSTDEGHFFVGDYPGPLGIFPLRRADHGPELMQPDLRIPARRWLVFQGDGLLTATLITPEGFELYAVTEGWAWGLYLDELEVESVRAYELSKE